MPGEAKTDLVYCLRILEAIGKIDVYSRDFDNPTRFSNRLISETLTLLCCYFYTLVNRSIGLATG